MSGSKHIQWFKWSAIVCVLLVASACQQVPAVPNTEAAKPPATASGEQKRQQRQTETYGPARTLGTFQDAAINESSGLVASRTTPGLYWTHNDSGDGPYIYAFDERGARRGTWRVKGATARDWEDIAAGPGPQAGTSYLYIGDIGDNGGRREAIIVYRFKEPAIKPADSSSNKRKPLVTDDAEVIRFQYPDGAHDSEALLVHPKTGDVYIVTKISFANPVIYKAAAPFNTKSPIMLKRIGDLSVPTLFGGLITGGSISPDGLRLALCDYLDAYEMVLPGGRASFDEIWKQRLQLVGLGRRRQGESIAYRLDGRALLATSEGAHAALVQVVRR